MKWFFLLAVLAVCAGCEVENSADRRQAAETAQRLSEADRQIGMPDIVNFTERRLMRDILELRDQENLSTYTYIVALDGSRIFLGESIGYGLPYSVQFTNPQVPWRYSSSTGYSTTLPQADPNGLFMPDSLAATWVLLKDPKTGAARPVYVEPSIIVSPFPLH